MSEVLVLERFDNTSWGFRLTGGLDFGTPLTVLKVIGGSIAELSGMKVGDLIVEINGKSAKNMTHVDAQNCIIECGDRITLLILRGSEVTPPASTPLRGMTPLHGVEEYLLNNLSDTHSFSQLTEKLDSVKRSELTATSMESGIDYFTESTRDIQSDDVSFVSEHHEKTYSEQAMDEVSDLEIVELMTGNEEVLDEGVLGINFKKFHPKVDFIRESEVFKLLQKENVHKEIPEEVQLKKDPTKRFSTFLMKPKPPPSPKPTGPYWHYPKPPHYLSKEEEKPKEEPRRRIIKEKGHTVLWLFLAESGDEVVDERWGTPEEERINESRNEIRDDDQMSTSSCPTDSETRKPKVKVQAQSFSLDEESQSGRQSPRFEATSFVENAEEAKKKQAFKRGSKTFAETIDYETSEELVDKNSVEVNGMEAVTKEETQIRKEDKEGTESGQETTDKRTHIEENGFLVEEIRSAKQEKETIKKEIKKSERETTKITEESSKTSEKTMMREGFSGGVEDLAKVKGETYEDFGRQLAQIQEQLEQLKGQAPGDLRTQLVEIKEQLSKMVQIESSSKYLTSEINNINETEEEYSSTTEEKMYESGTNETNEEEYNYEQEKTVLKDNETIEQRKEVHENGDVEYETEEHKTIIEEYERGEFELCEVPAPGTPLQDNVDEEERERREKKRRAAKLLTPQPRPIVLPGGRMWRRPKDAAYDEFYQGVLVEQAEVLVGTDGAVNFRKYIPPRFDAQNSAVAKFIHELEEKAKGHGRVSPEEKYYQTPISKRHFYAASLPQPEPKGLVELEEMYSDV